ncbi:hypothetical protein EYR40_003255 [Pleurotus pulmonarius]|nr:hypothetical protein EYR40_003255 [Pleurotus pulmonarius]
MPDRTSTQLNAQIEEIRLIKYSLLPDEVLVFLDDCADIWEPLLVEDFGFTESQEAPSSSNTTGRFLSSAGLPPHFAINLEYSKMRFEIELPDAYPDPDAPPLVSIKGADIARHEQERWQAFIKQKLEELSAASTEYLVYTLISSHLLPKLKSEVEAQSPSSSGSDGVTGQPHASGRGRNHEDRRAGHQQAQDPQYHALLTSHHLISPAKRRSLQQWAAALSVCGFAKVGYPGVMYVCGARGDVEEFVRNVRGMQWLALKVRFVEALPMGAGAGVGVGVGSGEMGRVEGLQAHGAKGASAAGASSSAGRAGGGGYAPTRDPSARRWTEVEKVGEVVEEMRRMGREEFIVQMGIGSLGSGVSASR